jgi:hypothetical protein
VRTHEITENDLKPIYIGSQQNLGVGGPPPLIAAQPEAAPVSAPVAPPAPAAAPGIVSPGTYVGAPPAIRLPGGTTVTAPPGSSPVPGTVPAPVPPVPPTAAPVTQPPVTQPPAPAEPAPPATPPGAPLVEPAQPAVPAAVPTTSPGIGGAQVIISPPGPTFRVGGGPYTVPLSVLDAQRLSTVTLTLVYDATRLRVRTVQEGSFMRAGGVSVAFAQQVNGNRIDITLARGADATGASGTGVLAAVLFDAIAPGPVTLTLSGMATGPGGAAMGLRFTPVTITVQ